MLVPGPVSRESMQDAYEDAGTKLHGPTRPATLEPSKHCAEGRVVDEPAHDACHSIYISFCHSVIDLRAHPFESHSYHSALEAERP